MMAFKLLRKKLNSCLGNYSYDEAAEISIRVFSFFFILGYRRTVNKTACSILWHSLSKFVLSLGSEFSRHPEGLSF